MGHPMRGLSEISPDLRLLAFVHSPSQRIEVAQTEFLKPLSEGFCQGSDPG